jgi:hypothetical protein
MVIYIKKMYVHQVLLETPKFFIRKDDIISREGKYDPITFRKGKTIE